MGENPEFDHQILAWVNHIRQKGRAGVRGPGEFVALEHVVHEMRLFKSAAELQIMRDAAADSGEAHRRAMQVCRPGLREYELDAEFMRVFRRYDGWPAYPPIVGGGRNGCILHYIENRDQLADGDLVLIDAGCELECYASDITRTFPVNGRFSPEQARVYEVVLAAQNGGHRTSSARQSLEQSPRGRRARAHRGPGGARAADGQCR